MYYHTNSVIECWKGAGPGKKWENGNVHANTRDTNKPSYPWANGRTDERTAGRRQTTNLPSCMSYR